jgi:hypothetical protein
MRKHDVEEAEQEVQAFEIYAVSGIILVIMQVLLVPRVE